MNDVREREVYSLLAQAVWALVAMLICALAFFVGLLSFLITIEPRHAAMCGLGIICFVGMGPYFGRVARRGEALQARIRAEDDREREEAIRLSAPPRRLGRVTKQEILKLMAAGLTPEQAHNGLVEELERRFPGYAIVLLSNGDGFDVMGIPKSDAD